MTKIAFQGAAGAYSYEAIGQFFGRQAERIPQQTFSDIFTAVEGGAVDYGMLPVENAVAGSVAQSYELLVEHDLRIYAEVILRVRHMLLAPPGTEFSALKRVRSHPQALAQCQRYLVRHGLVPEPVEDTAAGACNLAGSPVPEVGVIAGEAAAEVSGLEIIDRDIEDFPFNYTRFFVLGMEDPPRAQRSKTSIVFTTPHQPGALFECIGEFSRRGINLTKIESRPRLNRPWQYIFYLDFEGHAKDPECEAAMMGLLRRSLFVKLLGSYPAATTPIEESDTATEPSQEVRK
ncbi:MAG: prephenate dehydratase [Candidatus Bipolaricaulota bacterium]|nr:prephenate dehydratase [Candidatus Bipolaricaulota bacterium]